MHKQYRQTGIGFLISFVVFCAGAQPLFLHNPSLEDARPRPAKLPLGWFTCAPLGYSLPDIHPGGAFQVKTKPCHGRTYVGMVGRPDGSLEGICQELAQPLDSGACYLFALYAALSPHYLSFDPQTGQSLDYNRSLRIKVLGGISRCGNDVLLGISPPVVSSGWTRMEFFLQPVASLNFLRIEADFLHPDSLPYGGHVLIDALSPLFEVSCDDPKLSTEPLFFPATIEECRAFLVRHLYPLPENAMQKSLVWRPNGHWDYGNPALFALQTFMDRHPERGPVTLAVRRLADKRILLRAFQEHGLQQDKYRVKVWHGRACPPGWICLPD